MLLAGILKYSYDKFDIVKNSDSIISVHKTTPMVHFPSPIKSISVGEPSGYYDSRSFSSSMEMRNDARLNESRMEEGTSILQPIFMCTYILFYVNQLDNT